MLNLGNDSMDVNYCFHSVCSANTKREYIMSWNATGAIGEICGAIAVVITLIYLSRQLRENTKSIRLQSVESTFKEWNECLKDIQSIDGVGLAYAKALKGEPLSELEENQLTYLLRRIFNAYAKMQYLKSIGVSDPFNSESLETALPYLLKIEFFGQWWPAQRIRYGVAFQRYLDDFIQQNS
jgi:hypothetical protein